jgi:predicted DNA-binding transcriptional regulator AlpA
MRQKMRFAAESINYDLATLTREQAARALGISTDTLDALHARGEGPPRFRASPRRWAYPAAEFRRWQERRQKTVERDNAA